MSASSASFREGNSFFLRAWLLRRAGMFAKDAVQVQRVVGGLMALMVALVLLPLVWTALVEGGTADVSAHAVNIFRHFLLVVGFAVGLALTAEEEENETRFFLDRLPVSPVSILFSKFVTGLIMLALWFAVGIPILGMSTGQGPAAFYALLQERYDGSYFADPMGALLAVSLLATGIAGGLIVGRNILVAALVGFVVHQISWISGLMAFSAMRGDWHGLRLDLVIREQYRTDSLIVLALITVGMLAVAAVYTGRRDEASQGIRLPVGGLMKLGIGGGDLRPVSVTMRHLLVPSVVAVAVACGAALFVFPSGLDMDNLGVILGVSIIVPGVVCCFLGGYACHPGEREQRDFFVYALPLNPLHFHLNRLRGLALAGAGVGLAVGAVLLLTTTEFPVTKAALLALPVAFGLSSAFTGYLMRLFMRPLLAAAAAALLLAGIWGALAGFIWGIQVSYLDMNLLTRFQAAEAILWPALVLVALPFAAIMVSIRGSLLLELNETPRGFAMLLVLFVMAAWGAFLLTLAPSDFWTILFG